MQKNDRKTLWNTKTLVFMALLVAMHLVLTRVLVIELGAYRISVGSVCTILAGLWMGPLAGGVCGLAADLLGCLMKGYAVNPLITIAAILWGAVPPLFRSFYAGTASKGKKAVVISISVIITSVFSSLIFTTAGLVLFMGYNFYAIMPGRLVQFCIMTPIYCVLTCMLYLSPLTGMVTSMTVGLKKKAA